MKTKDDMKLKSGQRLRSQVCSCEVIVVRPAPVDLTCGGHPMVPLAETPATGLAPDPALTGGNELGKRYTNSDARFELLVTKAGEGTLADGATPLALKPAKPLPSSD